MTIKTEVDFFFSRKCNKILVEIKKYRGRCFCFGENLPKVKIILKCYYDQNLMSSLSQKRFLFSLSEVAVPVSVIEMNFGAL